MSFAITLAKLHGNARGLKSFSIKLKDKGDFKKALLRYLSREKLKSIAPSTFTLFIVKTFSLVNPLVGETVKNIDITKKKKIYLFKGTIEYFNVK